MMTEIQILEGQKDVSSLEGTTLKKKDLREIYCPFQRRCIRLCKYSVPPLCVRDYLFYARIPTRHVFILHIHFDILLASIFFKIRFLQK